LGSESTEWWGAGMVICLEQGADLHMAQLMPLPLTVSCFSKIYIGFTFLVVAYPGSPGKGPLNGCVCVIGQLNDVIAIQAVRMLFLGFVLFFTVNLCLSAGILFQLVHTMMQSSAAVCI